MSEVFFVTCTLCLLREELSDDDITDEQAQDIARIRGWIIHGRLGAQCPECQKGSPTVRRLLENRLAQLKRQAATEAAAKPPEVDQKKIETKRYTAEEARRWGAG